MKDFIIITDSCCDLPREYIQENEIPFVSLICNFHGREYLDDFGHNLSYEGFYGGLKNGVMPKTSQPSTESFYQIFKHAVSMDKDIIYICVSSGLSGTYGGANIAKNMILEEYKNAKIEIIDSLSASVGQGLLVIKALEMKKNKISYDEIIRYLNKTKFKLNTYITVNDLDFLKNGGRISSTAAFLGRVLHVKPILTLNKEGKVLPVRKAKGRKAALNKLVEFVVEKIENPEEQIIGISHGDCKLEAEKLKEAILKKINVKDVIINFVGPVVGSYGGPGSLSVFFIGNHRQNHIIDI